MIQAKPEEVRRAVEALIGQGFLSPEMDPAVHVGEPLAVMHPTGGQHSWFVPLEAGRRLAGFAQLLTDLVPMRVSSFQRRPHDFDNCPETADWTDTQRIAVRAASIARPGERLSQPVLSYDGNPDRLAWRIEAKSPSGSQRLLFVAGTAVYEGGGSQGLI